MPFPFPAIKISADDYCGENLRFSLNFPLPLRKQRKTKLRLIVSCHITMYSEVIAGISGYTGAILAGGEVLSGAAEYARSLSAPTHHVNAPPLPTHPPGSILRPSIAQNRLDGAKRRPSAGAMETSEARESFGGRRGRGPIERIPSLHCPRHSGGAWAYRRQLTCCRKASTPFTAPKIKLLPAPPLTLPTSFASTPASVLRENTPAPRTPCHAAEEPFFDPRAHSRTLPPAVAPGRSGQRGI
jgi:hypothetical protein